MENVAILPGENLQKPKLCFDQVYLSFVSVCAMSAFSKLPITMRGIYYTVSRLKLCTMCTHTADSAVALCKQETAQGAWEKRVSENGDTFIGTASQFESFKCASKQFQVKLFLVGGKTSAQPEACTHYCRATTIIRIMSIFTGT